ncbi:prominin-1-A-like [Rhinophrynus dorsalis]
MVGQVESATGEQRRYRIGSLKNGQLEEPVLTTEKTKLKKNYKNGKMESQDFLKDVYPFRITNDQVKEILTYEIGYLVALAIGILFIVLMTLVGLFFCCCRCCGNCGGKMYQKQTKRTGCKRVFLYIFLLCITLIIIAGDVCVFYSNSKFSKAVEDSFNTYNNTIDNVKIYINSIPKEVDTIINTSDQPINKANASITDIGPNLGGMIKTEIEKTANSTLDSVKKTVNELNDTKNYMTAVSNSFKSLQEEQKKISENLTSVQKQINDTLNACGAECSLSLSVDDLKFDASFNELPNFTEPMKSIDDVLDSGVVSTLQKARQKINDIPETVTNQTRSTVSKVRDELVKIKSKINDTRKSIPIVDTIGSVNSTLDSVNGEVDKYKSEYLKYDYYRWIVGIILACIVLLVILCNVFGLLLGPCGHSSDADPTERGCLSNSGGNFFMAGAGFSFIFAWLLMLVVGILFAAGGNSYTLVCKPWTSEELYKFIDTLKVPELNLSTYINDTNVTIYEVYSNCQKNNSLWNTLQLYKTFNLEEQLNITKYTDEVKSTVDNMNISLSNVKFLNDEQRGKVQNVSSSGLYTLNFTDLETQFGKNTTKINLSSFAKQLLDLSDKTTDNTIKEDLRKEANTLLDIERSINTTLLPNVDILKKNVRDLQSAAKNLAESLNKTLNNVDDAQKFMDSKVSEVVKNVTTIYLNTLLSYFESYISWAKTMLTQYVARCAPVAKALNSARTIVCDYLVDTVNGFWFSLGWCTIFFIPSIILSVKLAKYYRRMKSSDVFDNNYDNLEMTSTTSQQFLFPRVKAKP